MSLIMELDRTCTDNGGDSGAGHPGHLCPSQSAPDARPTSSCLGRASCTSPRWGCRGNRIVLGSTIASDSKQAVVATTTAADASMGRGRFVNH
eukprot:scaffold1134_cov295-Prasinococcus_capsulatus_cf.AAC.12